MSLLDVQNLTAGYGNATVLDDLTFTVGMGESLAVLGRNGVGKTTLMLAIIGHARRFGGKLQWKGHDIATVRACDRAHMGIGWVPQERDIFPSLTVEENLLVARRAGPFDLAEIYRLFPRLQERRRNMGDKLSGGEQQMLAIGRALITNPELILLDEPFEGLAPVIVEELEATLSLLRSERRFSLIIVEQHAEDALRLSDRAIVLDRGRLVLQGSSAELLANFDEVRSWIAV